MFDDIVKNVGGSMVKKPQCCRQLQQVNGTHLGGSRSYNPGKH